MDKPSSTSSGLWSELKRRKVVRVGVVYLVVAWAVIQIADTTFPSLNIPDWALSLVVMCVILGFPVAIVLAWAFELTPDGIRTTKSARQEQGDTPVSKTQQRKRNWMAYGIGAAVPTAIFGVVAGFFYLRTDSPPSPLSTISDLPSSMEDRSIAVLPLANMSPDPENAFFADGVQEDILTNLSLVKDLRVISRTSTLKYRDTDLNMRQIGEELGVHYLLEGSVRRAGNEVLVTVQLIDATTDEHIWAENYNRTLDNIFAIQAEIAKTIASKLHAVISPQGLELIERRPTESQEAYDLYLKARNNRIRYTEEGIAFTEQAVALDPEFAEAWAQLAKQLILTWRVQHYRNYPERLERAKLALSNAKRLGPELPTTLNAENMFAYNLGYDLEAGIEILLRALEITPNSTEVLNNLAYRYMQIGRLAEAQHFVEKSVEVDPNNLSASLRSIRLRSILGQWEQLETRIQECESRIPDYPAWERIRVENQYIEGGGLDAFIAAMKSIPGFATSLDGQLWFSLVSRNFTDAIRLLNTGNVSENFGFLYYCKLLWTGGDPALSNQRAP